MHDICDFINEPFGLTTHNRVNYKKKLYFIYFSLYSKIALSDLQSKNPTNNYSDRFLKTLLNAIIVY